MTGEVSVRPYPSIITIRAAVKILSSLTWQAAEPVTIAFTFPPNAALHLLKISLLAMPNFKLYNTPLFLFISNWVAKLNAQ